MLGAVRTLRLPGMEAIAQLPPAASCRLCFVFVASPTRPPFRLLLSPPFVLASSQDYQAFVASSEGAAALATAGIGAEDALAKMRLLAFMGLAHGAEEITFDQIQVRGKPSPCAPPCCAGGFPFAPSCWAGGLPFALPCCAGGFVSRPPCARTGLLACVRMPKCLPRWCTHTHLNRCCLAARRRRWAWVRARWRALWCRPLASASSR